MSTQIRDLYKGVTAATVAAANALIAGERQKMIITVTADENNGGATTEYKYEGSGSLIPNFDKVSSTFFDTVSGEIVPKDASITLAKLAAEVTASFGAAFTPTAVKTSAYTAAVGEFVPVDTTSGNVAITLPNSPSDKAQIAIKMVTQGGTNTVSVARNSAGTDVFNKAGGNTTLAITLLNEGGIYQYQASTKIWYKISDNISLAQLDIRYAALIAAAKPVSMAVTGTTSKTITLTFGDGSTIQTNFTDLTAVLTPLSAPVMSTPTVVSSTALTPTWTNVANETNYQLERSLDSSTWSTINSPAADVTSFADTGRTASTLYYYRIKAIGNGTVYSDSPYSNVVSATTSAAVTTPATPTSPVTDDTNNTFGWTNSSGYTTPSQYEYTINGGTSYTTATANPQTGIGDVALAIGQVGVRVKAVGGVNNASGTLFNTTAFTVAAGATLTAITSWPTLSAVTQSTNNLSFATTGTGSAVAGKFIPNGGTGEVWMTFDESGTTGYLGVAAGTGTTPQSSMTISIWKEGANKFRTRDGGNFTAPTTDNALPISTNSVGRIRFTGASIFTEVSIDGGSNWISCRTIAQPASDLYVKAFFDTNPTNIRNIKGLNLS